MMNCQEATRLLSERQERSLTLRERVALGFHLLMCHLCRSFGKNVEQFHIFLKRSDRSADQQAPGLSLESRQRLQNALEKELG